MKKFYLLNLILMFALTTFLSLSVKAQSETPQTQPDDNKPNAARRADFLQELGLTDEQSQQLRRINAEKKPLMHAAQQRLQAANRALDEAVYADAPDDAAIQAGIKEVQTAQAEVIKIRTLTEFAVRRILTAEQLTKFREARRRFQAAAQERRSDNKENRLMNAPNRNNGAKFGNRRQQRANAAPNN